MQGSLRRKFSIGLLVCMALLLMADQQLLPPNYLDVMQEFGVSEAQLGLVSAIYVIVGSIVAIGWGALGDIKSRKNLLTLGVFLGQIPCFLTAFVQTYWQLLVVRMFTGIGVGALYPISYSLISDMFKEEERGKGFSYLEVAIGGGTILGVLVAGFFPNWRTPFIIISLPSFVVAIVFYAIYQEPKRGEGEEEVRDLLEEGSQYTYTLNLNALKKSFKTKTNLLVFVQGILGMLPWGVISYWLVSYLRVAKGMTKSTASIVLLTLGIGTMVGNIIGGAAGDYFEKKKAGGRPLLTSIAILLGTVTSILLLFLPFSGHPTLLEWVLLILYSIFALQFISYSGPNVRAVLSRSNLPEDRGSVFGIFNLTDHIGKAVGPLLAGSLIIVFQGMLGYSSVLAYKWTLITGALFWIPCALLWLPLISLYPKDKQHIKKTLQERKNKILGADNAKASKKDE